MAHWKRALVPFTFVAVVTAAVVMFSGGGSASLTIPTPRSSSTSSTSSTTQPEPTTTTTLAPAPPPIVTPPPTTPAPAPQPQQPSVAVSDPGGITPSVEHWLAINQCEQGGDWHAYGRFGNGLMGGGGLGLSDGAWQEWGGLQYAANASLATPEQQMLVASVGYRRYGDSPWGCKV